MMDSNHTPQPGQAVRPFRRQTTAALLAALGGWAGAHWAYLGRRHGWLLLAFSLLAIGTALRAEVWYFHPAFFLFLVPAIAGMVEALVFSLMSNARFDARYNAGQPHRNRTGWPHVAIATLTLFGGTIVLVLGIVLMVQSAYHTWFAS